MVGNLAKCRLSPLSTLYQRHFINGGTTATTKPGRDEDCMQQLFGPVSEVTPLASLVIFQSDNNADFFSFALS